MLSLTGFFNTIILLGTLQGFIVCSLLYFSPKSQLSDRLLAKLIFLMSLASLNLYLSEAGVWDINGLLSTLNALLPMVIVMPIGPLLFYYIRSSVEPSFQLRRKDRLHFYTIAIDLVPSMTVIIFFAGVYLKLVRPVAAPWGLFIDNYNVYADIPRWMSVTFYLLLSARYLKKMKNVPQASNFKELNFVWMRQFVRVFLAFQFIWLLYLIPYVIPRYTNYMLDTFKWYPVYVPMAVLIYWLGLKGYLMAQRRATAAKRNGMAHSSVKEQLAKETVQALTRSMEIDRLYLDPNLNLAGLARHTGLAPKTISAVLNHHLQKSFNEFINEYRVEAIKTKLQENGNNHLTIAGVAMECGFNSQATFQRTFKDITGMSPSAYRKTAPEFR